MNKRLRRSLIAHDLLVNTAKRPRSGGRRKRGRIRVESCLTPGLCPPVKHLDFANGARTIGLLQRTEKMKTKRRGRQGKPDGNASGQRLQSQSELKRGDYSSPRWATEVIIKDHSGRGLVALGRREKNVHGSHLSHESGVSLPSN